MGRTAGRYPHNGANDSLSAQVEALIVELLYSAVCTEAEVARRFSINRRTLHRRLMNEKTTYSEILNRVRLGMMCNWYVAPIMTLTELASRMGFGSLSALSRWRKINERHAWKRATLKSGETYWADGDAYSFVIELESAPRQRKQGD